MPHKNCLLLALATLTCLGLGGSVLTAEDQPSTPTLTIGSKAPELNVEHWISNGNGKFEPVTKFEAGRVYVVEFWATWCGPCIGSMPHLAELQEKVRDQGVQIISISDEDLETVNEFLKGEVSGKEGAEVRTYAQLTNGYCLTTDPDRSAYRDYMEGSGERGIPRAFLVGKSGDIEWIGHPQEEELEAAIGMVLKGTWDRADFLAKFQNSQTWGWFQTRVNQLVKQGDYDSARALLASEQECLRVRFKDEPILLEQLQEYGPELEEKILLAPAFKKYESDEFEAFADELEAVVAKANEKQLDFINSLRFGANLKVKRYAIPTSILVAAIQAEAPVADNLNNMSQWVYEEAAKENSSVPHSLTDAALAAAERAVTLAPERSAFLDTLAHLVSLSGDFERAIKLETQAVEKETDEESKNQFRKALNALEDKRVTASPNERNC